MQNISNSIVSLWRSPKLYRDPIDSSQRSAAPQRFLRVFRRSDGSSRRRERVLHTSKPALKAFTAGVTDVYREGDTTYVEALYEDMDREMLPFAKFLQQHAFHEDMHKRQRLADIAVRSQLLDTHRGKHGYGKRTRRRQTAKRRTPVEGVSTMTLLAAFTAYATGACSYNPAQAEETTTVRGNMGTTASPENYSWTRPGIFRVRALPPPQGAQATRAAGPGLPTGGRTADYD